jgi:hypothetical protein
MSYQMELKIQKETLSWLVLYVSLRGRATGSGAGPSSIDFETFKIATFRQSLRLGNTPHLTCH